MLVMHVRYRIIIERYIKERFYKGVYHDAVIGLLSNAGYLLISCWIETDVDMKDWETKGK